MDDSYSLFSFLERSYDSANPLVLVVSCDCVFVPLCGTVGSSSSSSVAPWCSRDGNRDGDTRTHAALGVRGFAERGGCDRAISVRFDRPVRAATPPLPSLAIVCVWLPDPCHDHGDRRGKGRPPSLLYTLYTSCHTFASTTMRNRGEKLSHNDIKRRLRLAINDQTSAEVALLHLMDDFVFDFERLKAEKGLNINLSNIDFLDVAQFVGLEPLWNFRDAPSFDLHRSRIPTALFRNIVADMDILLMQYGTLQDHATEEARSRFLAPIFSHLVALFGGFIRNTPESLMNGHTTTRDRVNYQFKTLGAITLAFMEVKPKNRGVEECLNAIAQMIAECDACDWNNVQLDVGMPIYGILCNGNSFQFFAFDSSTKPYKFSAGVVQGGHFQITGGLPLVDSSSEPTARSFIHSLRPICETIFNLLLVTYIASLKMFRDMSQAASQPGLRKCLGPVDGWDKTIKFAEEALEKSQDAEALRRDDLIVDADATAEVAFKALKLSIDVVPWKYYINPPLMNGWNDDEVAKV